jgi:tryptophanyl-tRNA synthetase
MIGEQYTMAEWIYRASNQGQEENAPAAAEQVVTPWEVSGGVTESGEKLGIDYDKLIRQFGTRPIDKELLARFEEVTGHKPHILLRRGMFFSHR